MTQLDSDAVANAPLLTGSDEPNERGFSLASVGRSALILMGGTLAAQAIVVVRELFLAAQAGASSSVDALLVGIVLPVSLGGILTSGTIVALVPAYLAAKSIGGLVDGQQFAGAVLMWVGVASLFVFLLLELFAGTAVAITGSGLSAANQADAVRYLRIVAPVAFVSGLSGILFGVCQAEERFAPIAWATVATAATSVVVMMVLWDQLGLTAYALGSLLGPVMSLAILATAAWRRGILPRPRLLVRGIALGAFARHAVPLTIGASILQLNVIADVSIASQITPGAVGALRYGQLLINVPIGAIGLAWGRAIYPALVQSTLGAGESQLARASTRVLRYVFAVFVPLAALTAAAAPLIVSIAYGRGAFTSANIDLTTEVVLGLAPVIVVSMVTPVLTGALNARRMGTLLLFGGIMNVTLNFILDVTLGFTMGVIGIALSSSIATGIVTTFFALRLSRIEPAFHLRPIARCLVLAVLAALPAAAFLGIWLWTTPIPTELIVAVVTLCAVGVLGLVTYLAISRVIGLSEPTEIATMATRKILGRVRNAEAPG